MPSILTGFLRAPLVWGDFPRHFDSAPGPGKVSVAAFTDIRRSDKGPTVKQVAGSRPAQFEVMDNLTVNVIFNATKSFVNNWVFSRTPQFQNDMLNHEQGHFNITALVCRDFFVDVMLLKGQTFNSEHAANAMIRQIKERSLMKIQKIHDLYDKEVHPEQASSVTRGPFQLFWDMSFQMALTGPRPSGTVSPNGVPHKVTLVELLTRNGKKI